MDIDINIEECHTMQVDQGHDQCGIGVTFFLHILDIYKEDFISKNTNVNGYLMVFVFY